jgi:hypothetical protein
MSKLTIKTDGKWKNFKYINEVPKNILKSQFDYLDEDVVDGFLKYKNYWYHLDQFMRLEGNHPFQGWDGYAPGSAFSGVLIQLSPDSEQYRIGVYFS